MFRHYGYSAWSGSRVVSMETGSTNSALKQIFACVLSPLPHGNGKEKDYLGTRSQANRQVLKDPKHTLEAKPLKSTGQRKRKQYVPKHNYDTDTQTHYFPKQLLTGVMDFTSISTLELKYPSNEIGTQPYHRTKCLMNTNSVVRTK